MKLPLIPNFEQQHDWESYSSALSIELQQCREEGLEIEELAEVFTAVAKLPKGLTRKRLGDALAEAVYQAPMKADYPYTEPSTLDEIRALRDAGKGGALSGSASSLKDQITGAWMGRICGCLLGKVMEGIHTDEMRPFLQATRNWPLQRYLVSADLEHEIVEKMSYRFNRFCCGDLTDGMPVDDDTNYTVLAQQVISRYGRDFTARNMAEAWLDWQPKNAYCTAERVAFCNFVKGFDPPASAMHKNPYREWIGAQIRGDYFGYINPGNPQLAAEMAFRDASISHVKNGIYGEMWIAAMLAIAACTQDIAVIIRGGLAQIPSTSRLYAAVEQVLTGYENEVTQEACFAQIHRQWNEHSAHGWCHTISNAMIVAAALLYGQGDYSRSICMAVQTGFDTDCNGATVGSILGMAFGSGAIDEAWTRSIHDTLHTSIIGVGTVRISDCVEKTMQHIAAAR